MFTDVIREGIRVREYDAAVRSLSTTSLKECIHELNSEAEALGCAIFPGSDQHYNKNTLVIFAGNLERYAMLTIARAVRWRVMYFQDVISWWYGGSTLLPDIIGISEMVKAMHRDGQLLFFGQSSGAYASLVCGGLIPKSDVLACSPQTFSDQLVKSRIHASPSLAVHTTPDYLTDVGQLYSNCVRMGMTAILFAASEKSNPYGSHFWLDHLHVLRLVNIPAISLIMADVSRHSLVYRQAGPFSELLEELTSDQSTSPADRVKKVQQFATKLSDVG